MMNRNRLERAMRRRERRRLADINRNDIRVFDTFLKVTLTALVILSGFIIWIWAGIKQAEEVQAAVLRRHRITSQNITAQYPHSPNAGLQAEDPYMVESLPAEAPDHGEPPEAIEIIKKEATAAEAVPAERWESLGTYRLTFYCPCYQCSEGWGHQTASGATAVEGITVAVDPRLIPYGTHLQINGHEYIAQDCGGDIKGRRIDIFKESHQECLRNGIQKAEVFIKR